MATGDALALSYILSIQMCFVFVVAISVTDFLGISTSLVDFLQFEELIYICGV